MKASFIIAICFILSSCHQKTSYALKWKTASEFRNFGYDIYRAQNPKGPFKRITQSPIIGAGTSDLINEYIYTDKSLKKSKVYYYYIESISEDGKRKRFTPIKSVLMDD